MSTDSDQSKNIFFKDEDKDALDFEGEWSFSAEFDVFMADEDDDDAVDEDSKEWSFLPDGSQ